MKANLDYETIKMIEGLINLKELQRFKESIQSIADDLEEEMLDYIFRSRSEDNTFLEVAIMGKKILTAYERALEEGREEGQLRGEFKNKLETAR